MAILLAGILTAAGGGILRDIFVNQVPIVFVKEFYLSASFIGIAIFYGPTQTAARALMAKISPPEKTTEFFGLYAFAGKSTSWLVPGLMSLILLIDNNLQHAMVAIMLFNVLGIVTMMFVKEND